MRKNNTWVRNYKRFDAKTEAWVGAEQLLTLLFDDKTEAWVSANEYSCTEEPK